MLKRSCSSASLSTPLAQRVAGPVDAGAVLHGRLHLVADVGDPLGAPVGRRRSRSSRRTSSAAWRIDGWTVPARQPAAYSAAARPARAPKTRHSGSELEPSRLAPLMLTQAVSPAAYRPGERRRAVDVGVDAAHHVVHDRPHRDQLVHRVDPLVLQAQLADERQLGRR